MASHCCYKRRKNSFISPPAFREYWCLFLVIFCSQRRVCNLTECCCVQMLVQQPEQMPTRLQAPVVFMTTSSITVTLCAFSALRGWWDIHQNVLACKSGSVRTLDWLTGLNILVAEDKWAVRNSYLPRDLYRPLISLNLPFGGSLLHFIKYQDRITRGRKLQLRRSVRR